MSHFYRCISGIVKPKLLDIYRFGVSKFIIDADKIFDMLRIDAMDMLDYGHFIFMIWVKPGKEGPPYKR